MDITSRDILLIEIEILLYQEYITHQEVILSSGYLYLASSIVIETSLKPGSSSLIYSLSIIERSLIRKDSL